MTSQPRHYAGARQSYVHDLSAAIHDFEVSFKKSSLWSAMALNDVVQRYRGSILGPFWITITTGVFVGSIAFVFGRLFNQSMDAFLPWVSTGVVLWGLISTIISDGGDAFIAGGHILRQTATPLPVFLWRVVFRNLINFAHQAIVILVVEVWFHLFLKINLLLLIPGFVLMVVNAAWISLLCALAAARFRDVQQVIGVILQLVFLVSPIMWVPNGAKMHAVLVYNPVYYMLDVTRSPLLGKPLDPLSWPVMIGMAVVGWLVALGAYASVRRRIVHYL